MNWEGIGYTLFGEKPITTFEFVQDPLKMSYEEILNPRMDYLLSKGWKAWNRYSEYFPSKEFVFIACSLDHSDGLMVALIHKRHTLQAIQENLDLFKKVCGKEASPPSILNQWIESPPSFKKVLDADRALTGILLGFGRTNSLGYARSCEIDQMWKAYLTPPYTIESRLSMLPPLDRSNVEYHFLELNHDTLASKPSLSFSSLLKEAKMLYQKRRSFELQQNAYDVDLLLDPGFVVYTDPKEDAKPNSLKQKYAKAKKKITTLYREGQYLETTLQQWIFGGNR